MLFLNRVRRYCGTVTTGIADAATVRLCEDLEWFWKGRMENA
jgi:hypothetical protein